MVPYFSAFPPTRLSKREDAEIIEGNIASRKCRDAKSSDELALPSHDEYILQDELERSTRGQIVYPVQTVLEDSRQLSATVAHGLLMKYSP